MQQKLRIKTKEEFLDCYEKSANMYDKRRSKTYEGKRVDKLQGRLIYNIIKKNNCKKILEAGCGTGRILLPLVKKGLDCYGIDPSKKMLDQFTKKLKSFKLKANLKKGDIEKIPYKNNTFDCTYTMHVLMHLPTTYEKAFKEMYRITKKKGVVICDFPNKDSIWVKLSILLNPNKKRTNLYKVKELKRFFKKYNYKIKGLFSYARTFYSIPVLRNIISFLDTCLPLPPTWRTQIIIIVKKN